MTHYEVLGVTPDAAHHEVRRAYRMRAKELHPDKNPSPDAEEQFKALGQSYHVLRDTVRRAEYDLTLLTGSTARSKPGYPNQETAHESYHVCCSRCGRVDLTLRASAFIYAMSFLLVTLRRSSGGILCHQCRIVVSLRSSSITAVLGWWGFPWGPIYSLQSLFTNMAGGRQPREANASLLAALAVQLANQGAVQDAIAAARESLHLRANPAVSELLAELQNMAAAAFGVADLPRVTRGARLAHALSAMPIVAAAALIILGIFSGDGSNGPSPASSHSYEERAPTADVLLSRESASLDMESVAIDADVEALQQMGQRIELLAIRTKALLYEFPDGLPVGVYESAALMAQEHDDLVDEYSARAAALQARTDTFNDRVAAYNRKLR